MRSTAAEVVEVAVGVLRDADRGYLLSRRRPDVHQPGRWEFPGGKVEPGESPAAALCRELTEELGIRPLRLRELQALRYDYPDRTVRLHAYEVLAYEGAPQAREGQRLDWVPAQRLADLALPDANRGLLAALALPRAYLITDVPGGGAAADRDWLRCLERALAGGIRLACARLLGVAAPRRRALEVAFVERCAAAGTDWLLHAEPERALELAAALPAGATGRGGVHLPAWVAATLDARPVPPELWCAVSCHDRAELAQARRLGADFAVLGPVRPTRSHPGRSAMGWAAFAALAAEQPFPVYGLGGLGARDLPQAVQAGARGVAGISAFWAPELAPAELRALGAFQPPELCCTGAGAPV